jgi:hypothetical protein
MFGLDSLLEAPELNPGQGRLLAQRDELRLRGVVNLNEETGECCKYGCRDPRQPSQQAGRATFPPDRRRFAGGLAEPAGVVVTHH